MRKGFTLTEILVVIIILPFFAIILDGLFHTLIKDIPRSHQVMQENTTVLSVLDRMQKDIDKAQALPESFKGYASSDKLLLIELQDNSVICYQIKDDKIIREQLASNHQIDYPKTTSWSIPHTKVKWQILRENGNGHAFEVQNHIEHEVLGHLEKKMANSHLFYIGAF
jgi:prepilin-type N-terminal cleavage/methylation domain-containing protein